MAARALRGASLHGCLLPNTTVLLARKKDELCGRYEPKVAVAWAKSSLYREPMHRLIIDGLKDGVLLILISLPLHRHQTSGPHMWINHALLLWLPHATSISLPRLPSLQVHAKTQHCQELTLLNLEG